MSITLIITAVSIGIIHTLLGPDHYIPFIMLSKARGWGAAKTALITTACGAGHILGSVIIGFAGLWFGINVLHLEAFEGVRGSIAAWGFIAFGLVYFVWGLRRALKNRAQADDAKINTTGWVLFIIFVLGPCEPLIPVLMYPAATGGGVWAMALIALIFGAATITTMLTVVMGAYYGLSFVSLKPLQRWGNALAGFAILACGLSMQFLGL